MSKARLIGMNNAYIPNSKADMRFCKKAYQRNREAAPKYLEQSPTALNRRERRRMEKEKAGAR